MGLADKNKTCAVGVSGTPFPTIKILLDPVFGELIVRLTTPDALVEAPEFEMVSTTLLLVAATTFPGIPISTQSFAFSSRQCTGNQGITYSNNNRVGGVAPRPGMITNLEQIIVKGVVVYQIVMRQNCGIRACDLQQPELVNVVPENFTFSFDQTTKNLLVSQRNPNGPQYNETYAIQFHMNETATWMLCDYSNVLAP